MTTQLELPEPVDLHTHAPDATSVIVHNIAPAQVDRFLAWQREITRAAQQFPGYRATDVYPPSETHGSQWVVAVHFDDQPSLERWLDSPPRAEFTDRFHRQFGEYVLKTLPSGFGPWFSNEATAAGAPASWKIALVVWLGLYPTVMLLTILLNPLNKSWGLALSMLVSNALSVSILQWAVVPALRKLYGRWLSAPAAKSPLVNIGGVALIAATLAAMAILFRQFTG